ncbi:MAG: cation:proton antiporter [Alphaproteobacteria bacterium BRH_c36]|nr:MAG: cation:proton antiporter [Alphaproteobacteria bacterium BRH_c36]KUO67132.1 MAG: cation:proton antiporter [Alphaproteobacteria bacterium BRH_c36]
MSLFAEIVITGLLVIGAFFVLVGSMALNKLPDTLQRLHGPTKSTTLGVGSVLVASIIYFNLILEKFTIHELLISLFLFLTAPISAHLLAKAYLHTKD